MDKAEHQHAIAFDFSAVEIGFVEVWVVEVQLVRYHDNQPVAEAKNVV